MGIFKKAAGWLARFKEIPFIARSSTRTRWMILAAALLLIGAGGFAYYKLVYVPAQTATTTTTAAMQTAVVRQGNLIIYASGNGTLIASNQASFGFGAAGQITQVNAKVGDVVKAGDVLSEMDNSTQQIQYTQAKRALAELTSPYAIATAEQNIATALQSVATARGTLAYLLSPTVVYWEEQIAQAELDLAKAKNDAKKNPSTAADATVKKVEGLLDLYKDKLKGNLDYYEKVYVPQNFTARDRQTGVRYLAVPTDAEIANARAVLDQARATVVEAHYYLAALNGEPVPEDATGASLTALENAKLTRKSAEETLAGTQLIAPISGTLMTFDFVVGDKADTATLATIADLSQPSVETFLDPSDWVNVKIGKNAEITFDALPDTKFTGKVIQVDPGLFTSGNTSVVRAVVQVDIPVTGFDLPLGSAAAVDVIGGRADNALLVPIEALHPAGEQFTVFVMKNGKPTLQVVEVGVQDQISAEIKSGLQEGDVVTTGIAETAVQ